VKKLVGLELCRLWRSAETAGSFLFNIGHTGLEKSAYPVQLASMGVRPLFFVHDLIPVSHPEYCRPSELDKHVVRMDNVLKAAAGVIVNSQVTLDGLMRYADDAGKKMPPALVARLAAAALPVSSAHRPIAAPYFVMLGTIEARKNHLLILQLWRRMIETQGDQAPRLAIIGQRGWECEHVLDMLERCPALRGS
jgi:hypothetical protein